MNALLSLAALAFVSVASVGASAGWSAEVGLGGFVVPGTWAPLRVSAPVDVGPWTLEIRAASGSGREAPPVTTDHPAGGLVEEPIYLADATRSLKLRFLTGGLVKEELTLDLSRRLFPGQVIGVWNLGPAVETALAEVLLPGEPVRVVPVSPADFPSSPLAWGSLAALVLADPGPVLAPAQVKALRAWVASGGVLVLVAGNGTGSLGSQLGPVSGLGRWTSVGPPPAGGWGPLLGLHPYGQVHRLGTDFGPPARDLPPRGSRIPGTTGIFLVAWAALGSLGLVLVRRPGRVWPLAWATLGTLAALGLWTSGNLDWDRGLPVHGREVVLPEDLGRFVSVEAAVRPGRSGPFDWPSASPWALAQWKASQAGRGSVRVSGPDRVAVDSFEAAVDRSPQYRVVWTGRATSWSRQTEAGWVDLEEIPAGLKVDGPWLAGLARDYPGTPWWVGRDGDSTWAEPATGGKAP